MPSLCNPHKVEGEAVEAKYRLAMVEKAVEDIEGFSVLDLEVKRGGSSFTAETLEELIQLEPNRQFSLILGDESVSSLPRWHRIDEIIEWVPLLIGRRQLDFDGGECLRHPKLWEAVTSGMTPTSLMEISATSIRERLKEGLYSGHLLPAKVLDYIAELGLYSNHG